MPIKLIGQELEGGWLNLIPGTRFISEQSVVRPDGFQLYRNHWGEAVSPPLEKEAALAWLDKNYPTHIPPPTDIGTRQERSCGYHIHLSFTSPDEYRYCTKKKFSNFMKEEWKRFGEMEKFPDTDYFWYRLAGKNRFCTDVFQPGPQMAWKEKGTNRQNRRSILNYPLYNNTVEWRVLPMFANKEVGKRALLFHLDVVERFLAAMAGEDEGLGKRRLLYEARIDSVGDSTTTRVERID